MRVLKMFDTATGSQGMYDTYVECPKCARITKCIDEYSKPETAVTMWCCNKQFDIDIETMTPVEFNNRSTQKNILLFGKTLKFGVNAIYHAKYHAKYIIPLDGSS